MIFSTVLLTTTVAWKIIIFYFFKKYPDISFITYGLKKYNKENVTDIKQGRSDEITERIEFE